ncbi:MAG: ATP phosphoribosyltransferase [Kineosporiaceae bacterium]
MLRVAVPNKGSLSADAADMLKEAGYRQRRDPKELMLLDRDNDIEFFYLRPRDIAVYVGAGTLDVGITGRDLLLDSGADAREVMPLGFAESTFRFAARPGQFTGVADLAGRRVATSYAGLVAQHLAEHGVSAEVVRLDGAVETAVQLGVADVIADVVETGGTLRAAGLEVFGDPILRSESVLVRRGGAADHPGLEVLVRRLEGVLVARQYVLMDYDVRVELVEKACAITPGLESPTVSPLHDQGWVAVRVMVRREVTNHVMDDLYALGARAILVTSIHACRL